MSETMNDNARLVVAHGPGDGNGRNQQTTQGSVPRIDPEFEALIPPLSAEEIAGLEASILAEGCRVPLDVWDGVLVDGHHRFKICTAHGIPFEVKPIHFEDRAAALDWITRNQSIRRNLKPDQRTILIGRTYLRRKKGHGGDRKSKAQNAPLNAAEAVGAEFGIHAASVKRAAQKVAMLESHPALLEAVSRGSMRLADAVREIRGQSMNLVIDPEFSTILPPLKPYEYAGLEENIRRHGCRQPLQVWNGIILDGHARYKICKEHGIPFQTIEIELEDRDAAYDYVISNQLGRVNLNEDQALLIRRRIEKRQEGRAGAK